MKSDGKLARNPIKGALGDALHAVLCGAGYNIRVLLSLLRLYAAHLRAIVLPWLGPRPVATAVRSGEVCLPLLIRCYRGEHPVQHVTGNDIALALVLM